MAYDRMKWVETNEHIIREAVERGEIVLEHVKSHDNDADMLTKLSVKPYTQNIPMQSYNNDHGPTHSKPYKPEPTSHVSIRYTNDHPN